MTRHLERFFRLQLQRVKRRCRVTSTTRNVRGDPYWDGPDPTALSDAIESFTVITRK